MTRIFSTLALVSVIAFSSCKKDQNGQGNSSFNRSVSAAGIGAETRSWPALTSTIPATITGAVPTVLTNDRVWILDGPTYVSSTGTLIIQPNTLIKAKANSTRGISYLVVTKGGQLRANGNAAATSIVFTTDKAVGSRTPGSWGGIILLGDSRIHTATNSAADATAQIEGIVASEIPAGYSIAYGGNTNVDRPDTLNFVRIEYPGRDLGQGNEINGLTLGGVRNNSKLSNIQVSYSSDDAYEFFGGQVNADHLIALGTQDDDFDFDFGYTGTIQYAVSLRDPSVPYTADANGIESDNDGIGSTITPLTRPTLDHFTILGTETARIPALLHGNRWRRNTSLNVTNSIVAGYNGTGVFFELVNGTPSFTNSLVHGFTTAVNPAAPGAWFTGNTLSTIATANDFLKLQNAFNVTAPDFRYAAGSPAAGTGTTYKGAFAAWTAIPANRWDWNWASYNPQNGGY